jgi:putative tryptophan/tyrosine transport system substrate-binding protein
MRRREFITFLGAGAATWPLTVRAQQPNVVKRIGWLTTAVEGDRQLQSLYDVFPQELQRLGWTSGRNLQIHQAWAAGDDARLRVLAAELVRDAPDAIVCSGTQVTAILKQQTSTIPIVFVNVADPVTSGFTASFAHPGGNVTGFTSLEYSLAGKWLGILRDIAPGNHSNYGVV